MTDSTTTLGDFEDESSSDNSDTSVTNEQQTNETTPDPDLYHPEDEWNEIKDESQSMGVDWGRNVRLAAVENKDSLDFYDKEKGFNSITELVNALREISLVREDGYTCFSIESDKISRIKSHYESIPEEAQPHFLTDSKLVSRVNSARKRFNEWMGKYKRVQKTPSWVESGPANYNHDKYNQITESERTKKQEVVEAIGEVRAAANGGAKQRALNEIGSSVAELNEEKSKSKQEQLRDRLEEGMVLKYRSPREHIGCVVRVNKKSVRVERPNPRHPGTKPLSDEPEPEYIRETIQLDNDFLEVITEDMFEEIQNEFSAAKETLEETANHLRE